MSEPLPETAPERAAGDPGPGVSDASRPGVDAHTHLLPPRLARRVRAVFDTHLPEAVVYPLDEDVILDDLAAAGIGTAWSLPYAHAPGVADWLNPAMLDHLDDLGDRAEARGVRLVAGCTVHPGDGDPVAIVARALDAGARVVKLHTSVGSFTLDDPGLAALWPVLTERRVPVVVHAGRHVAGIHDGPGLDEVDRVAAAHPRLRLIVAHAALPEVDATVALLDRHASLHADLTPVLDALPALDPTALTRHADRLLFGSDAPNTGVHVPDQVASWRDAADPAVAAAILGGTAARLLAAVDG